MNIIGHTDLASRMSTVASEFFATNPFISSMSLVVLRAGMSTSKTKLLWLYGPQ